MLAEKRVFDKDGKDAIDSVKDTNLYNVLTYLIEPTNKTRA